MRVNTTTQFCQGISDISDSYSGFIIDQWGVIHNGEKPYPGAVECLRHLKSRNKHVIILSNSGKRAQENKERLKKIGIGPSLYNTIMTSGEMTWQGLHTQDDGFFQDIGKKCYVMSRGGDRSIVNGLDLEVVDDVLDADFFIISGLDSENKTLKDYEVILKNAARKGLKAICANPDNRGIVGSVQIMAPGTVARRYEDFGGVVHYIGKPHQPIFKHCTRLLQEQSIYPGQTIMIGDSLSHDILGGAMADIDTCLVKNGLHEKAFASAKTPVGVNNALNLLAAQYDNLRPTYLVDSLAWGEALPDRKHKKRET